jgi:pSer/pThr/pTyr-binding forkhead associated (FHA) protein
MKHILELQVFDGDKLIVKQSFDQSKVVIGRILSADFRVPDSRVSRIHALLERLDDGSLRITDLASSHGTTVNGERVIERVVGPADDLRLAGLKLQMNYRMVDDTIRTPQKNVPPAREVPASRQVPSPPPSIQASAPQLKVSRDPTVVRSLKDSARTRGVLEATAQPTEELEVTVYWEETILNIDHFRDRSKTLRIGEDAGNDYIVASNVLPKHFDFIKVNKGRAEIQLHPSMRGSARVNGQILQFEQGSQSSIPPSVQISRDDIAKIQVGSVHFFLMFVGKPPAIPRDELFDQGRLFWFLQLVFSVLAIAVFVFASFYKAPIEGRVKEFPERFRRIIVQNYRAQVKPPVEGPKAQTGQTAPNAQIVKQQAQAGGNDGAGAREQGAEGKRGTSTSTKTAGVTNKRPSPRPPKNPKPVETPADSILSTLKNSGLSQKVAKSGGQESLNQAFSGVGGTSGSSAGSGASGLQGSGKGGGGTAVGVGGLGTSGFGTGAQGTGTGSMPGKGEVSISTESMNVYVLGSLSREEIERVVNSHRNEIRYCYDQELKRNPGLNGKVTMTWTIVEGGRVQGVSTKENTTGSISLANCIAGYLKDWRFPSPAQGSKAEVEWPWIFKPKGT